jgi:rhamnulokinase
MARHVLAVDLGAESGRVLRIRLEGQRLSADEMHRFPNNPVYAGDTLYWDALRLWHEIQQGVAAGMDGALSVGVDAWGVDFALLDGDGRLVSNPVHYRDARTSGLTEWVFERVPRRTIFDRTGVQFMPINTLYQFASLVQKNSPALKSTAVAVSMPDLFNYWLTGEIGWEFTHATTTQFYNPRAGNWDYETLEALGVPIQWFPQIVQPGARFGHYQGLPVIMPATHDTGSAVAAVPAVDEHFAYISSGTWSLIGLEVNTPILTEAAYRANVTNEGGPYGTFRYLKNVMGLWLAQQSRATWRGQGSDYSYDDLTRLAEAAEPFRSLIDPDAPEFLPPGDMPERVRAFCRATDQPVPESVGQVMRAIYESLALKYRWALERMIATSGKRVDVMHVIGGGSRSALLGQMTANAIGRPVVAGPAEATALGNGIVQWITLGELSSLAEARRVVAESVATRRYEPQHEQEWDAAYSRFTNLIR